LGTEPLSGLFHRALRAVKAWTNVPGLLFAPDLDRSRGWESKRTPVPLGPPRVHFPAHAIHKQGLVDKWASTGDHPRQSTPKKMQRQEAQRGPCNACARRVHSADHCHRFKRRVGPEGVPSGWALEMTRWPLIVLLAASSTPQRPGLLPRQHPP